MVLAPQRERSRIRLTFAEKWDHQAVYLLFVCKVRALVQQRADPVANFISGEKCLLYSSRDLFFDVATKPEPDTS